MVCERSVEVKGWEEWWVGETGEGLGGVEIVGVGERGEGARQSRMCMYNSCPLLPR